MIENRIVVVFALVLAAAIAGSYAGYWIGADRVQGRWDKAKAVQLQASLKAEADARAIEQALNQKLQEAQDAHTIQLHQAAVDAAAARSAINGLRNQLNLARAGLRLQPASPANQYAAAYADLLEQCAGEYQRVAEASDGHAADVKLLMEGWPK